MAVWGEGTAGWRWFAARLLVAVVALSGEGVAVAICGDGIFEGNEECDAGVANGIDGCCSVTCRLVDRDGDGLCDARDPCNGVLPVTVQVSRLQIARLGGVVGDERYRVSATMTFADSPPIDPTAHGLRLVVTDVFEHDTILSAAAPGGPGWTRTTNGSAWLYRNRSGNEGGVARADVRLIVTDPPTVAVLVRGWGAATGVLPSWHQAVVTLAEDGDAGQCGEATLTPSRCRFRIGGRLVCDPPPPIRSCTNAPDGVVCDTRNCASAQERYFVDHGYYLTGDCTGLPGFVASPDVFTVTVGNSTDFDISASNSAGRRCEWLSDPPPGYLNLECFGP